MRGDAADRKQKRGGRRPDPLVAAFALVGSLLLLFIILPIVGMVFKETPQSIGEALSDPAVTDSILLSMGTALAATLVAAALGIPLAYVMARHDFRGKGLV